MTDFSTLQLKVNDFKAKVEQNSITPHYLGALLDNIIAQMKAIDMTDMSDEIRSALNNSRTALENAQSALNKAGNAETSANSALQNALSAIEKATTAMQTAGNANTTASSAMSTASVAMAMATDANNSSDAALTTASAAMTAAESAVPKAVDVSDLDTMGTDGSIMAMRGLVVDAAHTRYCVTATSGQRARTVGYLDIMTDSGQHVLTQVLTTHYTFTPEGVLDSTSHTDSRIRTYFRSYGLSSGTVGDGSVPSLAWTSWREMVPETVAPVEVESEERLNAMLEAGELEDGRMYFVAEEE